MQPIFVSGFQRSGTTLLRRIISMHPSLNADLIHEGKRLLTFHNKSEALNNYKVPVKQEGKLLGSHASIESGEKIPYFNNTEFIKTYVERWLDFWPNSLFFHIVRFRDEVIESNKRVFKIPESMTAEVFDNNVHKMEFYFRTLPNHVPISYNLLVEEPFETIKMIYTLMGYCPGDDYINKVITNKEPWTHEKRIMCGFRYYNRIGKIER